jgi:hypothetical protein
MMLYCTLEIIIKRKLIFYLPTVIILWVVLYFIDSTFMNAESSAALYGAEFDLYGGGKYHPRR